MEVRLPTDVYNTHLIHTLNNPNSSIMKEDCTKQEKCCQKQKHHPYFNLYLYCLSLSYSFQPPV